MSSTFPADRLLTWSLLFLFPSPPIPPSPLPLPLPPPSSPWEELYKTLSQGKVEILSSAFPQPAGARCEPDRRTTWEQDTPTQGLTSLGI